MSAFRNLGHNAYSCDLKPCSGGFPQYHFQCDVRDVIEHPPIGANWDLMIAHPPCTFITKAGSCNFYKNGHRDEDRFACQRDAVEFFLYLLHCNIPRICVENPVPMATANLPPWSQVIYPELFGDSFSKQTCLWLKNLPPLMNCFSDTELDIKSLCAVHRSAALRSKTSLYVARAMADQWNF